MKSLTAKEVEKLDKKGKYHDLHGLFLRIEDSGSKRWVQRLTINGRRREIGLGSVKTLSLAKAREIALENLKCAREGRDPIAEKTQSHSIPSFEQACQIVFDMRKATWRNPKHAAQFMRTLETYAFPKIGKKSVSDITAADIIAVLEPIWVKKHETATRIRQRIGVVMQWSVAQQYCAFDPTQHVAKGLPKVSKTLKHRRSIHYDKVAQCMAAIRSSKAMQSTKLALEFVILTATRSGEVRKAVWSEVDLDAMEWKIPAERMKANREHRVPLSPRAVEILREARALDGRNYIFEGSKIGFPMSDMTMSKLVKELGFDADVHGFRTSFRVWAQERTNASTDVAEAALAHTERNKAVAAYARSDLFDKRRELMNSWSEFVAGSAKVL